MTDVLELARLACEQGASFDVVYEPNGDVRVSLYPNAPETPAHADIHPMHDPRILEILRNEIEAQVPRIIEDCKRRGTISA